jgi:hypothetical protein
MIFFEFKVSMYAEKGNLYESDNNVIKVHATANNIEEAKQKLFLAYPNIHTIHSYKEL